MQTFGWFKAVAVSLLFTQWMGTAANAAQCGTSAAGFAYWKQQFAEEARGRIGSAAIAALMSTQYAPATISADRGQRSFHLSLDEFLAKRGGPAIAARGRSLKQSHAALFASIEQRYGVPPGPLLAIWGMETVSAPCTATKTCCLRWQPSPTIAVDRPISPISFMPPLNWLMPASFQPLRVAPCTARSARHSFFRKPC